MKFWLVRWSKACKKSKTKPDDYLAPHNTRSCGSLVTKWRVAFCCITAMEIKKSHSSTRNRYQTLKYIFLSYRLTSICGMLLIPLLMQIVNVRCKKVTSIDLLSFQLCQSYFAQINATLPNDFIGLIFNQLTMKKNVPLFSPVFSDFPYL